MNDTTIVDSFVPVLIVAPTGRDAPLLAARLHAVGLEAVPADLPRLIAAIEQGQAIGVVAEEALGDAALDALRAACERQPTWADVPLIVMTARGNGDARARRILAGIAGRASVALLERPVRLVTLLSAVRAGQQARRRQYELRDRMQELAAQAESLRATHERIGLWLQATGSVFWTRAPDAAIVEPQPSLSAFTGRTFDQLRGWGWLETIHPADRDRVRACWQSALERRVNYECELRLWSAGRERYEWRLSRGVPVFDASGGLSGWVGASIDIEARKRSEQAGRRAQAEAERRAQEAEEARRTLEAILEHVPEGLALTGGPPDYRIQHISRYGLQLSGRPREALVGQPAGQHKATWGIRLPDGQTHPSIEQMPLYRAARFGEETHNRELLLETADGEHVPILVSAVPIRDGQGQIIGALNSWRDIRERKRYEQHLRAVTAEAERRAAEAEESRRTLEAVMRHIPMGIAVGEAPDVRVRAISHWGWLLAGRDLADLPSSNGAGDGTMWPPWPFFHAEDGRPADPHELPLRRAVTRGELVAEEEWLIERPDGTRVPILCAAGPIRDGRGRVIGGVVGWQDISERKHTEAKMRFLMAELNHRVKNALATIDAIAFQTARHSSSLEEFERAFSARVRSLSQAHTLLTRSRWEGALLEELIRMELSPRVGRPEQLVLGGPSLMLKPNAAFALHMVLHELCTNAAKYGALSTDRGRVAIEWTLACGESGDRRDCASDGRVLRLCWRETGGPAVSPPKQKGFGSDVLDSTITYELDGSVELDFRPEGLVCAIEVPWTRAVGLLDEASAAAATGR